MSNPSTSDIHNEDRKWFADDEAWLAEVGAMSTKVGEIVAGLESALAFVQTHQRVMGQYKDMVEASEKQLAGADLVLLAREFFADNPDEATKYDLEEHEINEKSHELLQNLHDRIVARQNAIVSSVDSLRSAILG